MIAPLLSSLLLLADPATGTAAAAPPATQVRLDDDDEDDERRPRDPDEDLVPNNPDGRGMAFAKAAGATCLATSGMCLLGWIASFVPGIGPALGLIVHLLNPWVAGAAGWASLNGLADWRAPILSMLVGAVVPFYIALGIQLIAGAALGVIAGIMWATVYVGFIGAFLVLGQNGSLPAMLGLLGAAFLIPVLLGVAVVLADVLVVVGGVTMTTLGSSLIGTVLGRGLGINEESFPFDLIKSPSLRVDGEPRRPRRRAPPDDGPRGEEVHPSQPDTPAEPLIPREPVPEDKPPPTSF